MIRNRLLYICAVSVCVAFVGLSDNSATYAALYVVLAIPLVSFTFSAFAVRKFTVTERLDAETVTKGADVLYTLTVENDGFVAYPRVKAFFGADADAVHSGALRCDLSARVFSVAGHGRGSAEFTVACAARGVFRIGVTKVVLYDTLGLFRFTKRTRRFLSITVLPRIVDIAAFPLIVNETDANYMRNALKTEDFTAVSDLREYRPADSLKRVHWKATAKRNEIIVKNYQNVSKNPTIIAADNRRSERAIEEGKNALVLEDLFIECVVSVAAFCEKTQFPTKLLTLDKKIEDAYAESFDALYEKAAFLAFEDDDETGVFAEYLSQAAQILDKPLNIVVFTRNVTWKTAQTLKQLAMDGNNAFVLRFAFAGEEVGDLDEDLKRCGVKFFYFDENTQLTDIF